jgi:hypothetical protein
MTLKSWNQRNTSSLPDAGAPIHRLRTGNSGWLPSLVSRYSAPRHIRRSFLPMSQPPQKYGVSLANSVISRKERNAENFLPKKVA